MGRTAGEREDTDWTCRLGRYLALKHMASVGTQRDRRSPPGNPLLLLSLMAQAVYRLYIVPRSGNRANLLAGIAVSSGIFG